MSGFPNRPFRTDYGPDFEDEAPVTNPKKEASAALVSLLAWQQAGMGLCVPRGMIKCSVSASTVTTVAQAFAWDPKGELSTINLGYTSAGVYTFALAQQYQNQLGVLTNVNLIAAQAFPLDMSTLAVGVVTLGTSYSGTIRFYDHANVAIEASKFFLLLW